MLQPSQVPTYLLFLGFIGFLGTVFLWVLRKGISNIQKIPDLSPSEGAVVRRQLLALLGVPLFLFFFALSPLGWNLRQPFIFFAWMIIGFAPLAYIAVSSIRNRVSILRGREPLPVKGAKAVWNGVMNLAIIVLVFTGYAIYIASLK